MALAAPFPAVSSSQASLRLTRRGRVVLGVAVGLLLMAIAALSGVFSAEADTDRSAAGPATAVVVVQQGESLWQIAKTVAPGADPRETITRIRELNALGEGPIVAGQSIVVPVPAGR